MSNQTSRSFVVAATAVRIVTWTFLWIAGTVFLVALFALSWDIVLRYGFNSSITGLHEAVVIAFIYVYMLGGAAIYARNQDVAMVFLSHRLPERLRPWGALVVHAVIAATMMVVFDQALVLVDSQKSVPTPALSLSAALQSIPIAVGAAVIVLTSLIEVWACLIWVRSGVRPIVWLPSQVSQTYL